MDTQNIELLDTVLKAIRAEYEVITEGTILASNNIETFCEQLETLLDSQSPYDINGAINSIKDIEVREGVFSVCQSLIVDSGTITGGWDIPYYGGSYIDDTKGKEIIYVKELPLDAECIGAFQGCIFLLLVPEEIDFSTLRKATSMFSGCKTLVDTGTLYMPKVREFEGLLNGVVSLKRTRIYAPLADSLSNLNKDDIKLSDKCLVFGRVKNCGVDWRVEGSNLIEIDTRYATGISGFSRIGRLRDNQKIAPYFRVTSVCIGVSELFYNEGSYGGVLAINARHWDTSNCTGSAGSQGSFVGHTIGLFSQRIGQTTTAYAFSNSATKNIYMMGDDADSSLYFNRNSFEGRTLKLVNGVVTIDTSAADYQTFLTLQPTNGDTYLNTYTFECFDYDGTNWQYTRTIHPDQRGFEYGFSHGYKGTDVTIDGNGDITDNSGLTPQVGDTYLNTDTMDAFVYVDDFTLVHGLLNATATGTALHRDWNANNRVYEIIEDNNSADFEAYQIFKDGIQVGNTYYNPTTDQYFTWLLDKNGNGYWKWRQGSRWDEENAHWHRNTAQTPTKPNRNWFYVNYVGSNQADDTIEPFAPIQQSASENLHWEWRCKSVIERHMTLTGANITAQSLCNLIRHVHINEYNELEGVIFTLNRNTYNNYAQGAMQDFTAETPRRTTTVTGTYAAQAQAVLDALWDNADNTDWLQFEPPS